VKVNKARQIKPKRDAARQVPDDRGGNPVGGSREPPTAEAESVNPRVRDDSMIQPAALRSRDPKTRESEFEGSVRESVREFGRLTRVLEF